MVTTGLEIPAKRKLWLAAIKLPMYSVAIVPITVGTAAAFGEIGSFNLTIFITFLLSAISIIAWLNLSNDVFDAETGIDQNKAHSVVNLTGNKFLVFWTSNLFLALGILGIVSIAWQQQDAMVLAVVLLCCALGYTYQGPPFRLGYQGLGEFICFLTFGPLAIAAAYYAQAQRFSLESLAPATLIGLTTSLILFCSHFHQVADDLAAGKRSPIVRLGTKLGSQILTWLTGSIFVLTGIFVALGISPIQTLLIFLSLPLAFKLVTYVHQYHEQPQLVSSCKFLAVNFHFISGMLLSLGLILSRLF